MPDILDPNPFAKPPKATSGDVNATDIYTSVGFSLHSWENCEIACATIYSALVMPASDNHTLMRAYGVIVSSSTRREMIEASCEAYFLLHKNEELRSRTSKLLNLYGTAASRRNEIAHGVVSATSQFRVVNKVAVPIPNRWFLGPAIFSTKKNTKLSFATDGAIETGPKYRYSTAEIGKFIKDISELEKRAYKVAQDIRAFHASLKKKSD